MSIITTSLTWVRHAPIKSMMPGKITGQRDVAVNLKDTQALKNCAAHLMQQKNPVWVTSTLSRTKKTAFALAREMDQKIKPVAYKELMEQNFGLWQSKTWDELADDAQACTFWDDPAHLAPPNGESFQTVFERTQKMIAHLVKNYPGENIILVTHAGTIRAALACALDLDLNKALSLQIDTLSLSGFLHIQEDQKPTSYAVQYINRL